MDWDDPVEVGSLVTSRGMRPARPPVFSPAIKVAAVVSALVSAGVVAVVLTRSEETAKPIAIPPAKSWAEAREADRFAELVGAAPAEMQASPAGGGAFDEARIVTLCDLNMQAQTARAGSYRSDWSWRTVVQNGVVAVRRGFAVTNVVGAEVRGEYTCLAGAATNQLVGLQFQDGDQQITISGDQLSQR